MAARLGRVVLQDRRQHGVHPAARTGQQVGVERGGDDLVANAQRGRWFARLSFAEPASRRRALAGGATGVAGPARCTFGGRQAFAGPR